MQKITPFLWFDDKAEEAAKFYVSVFRNSKLKKITRYPKVAEKVSGKPAGSVMTVVFEIEGQEFTALNGGPEFKFTEAVSFVINCKNQKEVDYYWDKLTVGGDPKSQICGWLKDKYGVSWQIVPNVLEKMLQDEDSEKSERVMKAVLEMKKIDVEKLKQAYQGK